MDMLILILAAHLPFIFGLTVGALLSPLLILAGLRAWDFFTPESNNPRVQPESPRGERRKYRPHYGESGPPPTLTSLQRAHLRKRQPAQEHR
jgi:hypothetical protein